MNSTEKKINKDLILREQLAIDRTEMANDRTLLSFIRTSLYFAVAGLTVYSLFKIRFSWIIELVFFAIALLILSIGLRKFYRMKKKLKNTLRHIGDYKLDEEDDFEI